MDQINGLVWLCFLCPFSIRSEHLLAYKELQTPVAFGMPFHEYQAKNSGEHSGWVANTPGPATWLLQGVTLLKSSSAPERRVNCSYAPFPPGESAVCSLREEFFGTPNEFRSFESSASPVSPIFTSALTRPPAFRACGTLYVGVSPWAPQSPGRP